MSNFFAEVLAIEVGLRGIERVESGFKKVMDTLGATEAQITKMETAMKLMGTSIGLIIGGVREAMENQDFEAMAEGLTGSLKEANKQVELANSIASKGVFTKEQAIGAIEAMDRYGISVGKNIDLVERLGSRSRNIESAANLIGMIEQGYTRGLSRRLKEFGIGPDKLRAAGLQMDGGEIKGTKEEILHALEAIERSDKTAQHLQGTLSSGLKSMMHEFKELVESLGAPFLGILNGVVRALSSAFRWIRDLNSASRGWVGLFITGGTFLIGLGMALSVLKQILAIEKVMTVWAGIRTALQAGPKFIAGLWTVLKFMAGLLTLEGLLAAAAAVRAFIMGAIAAFAGNWVGLAIGLGLLAAAGIGAAYAVNAYRNSNSGESESSADRPIRRDDMERIHKRVIGRAWTG